MSRTPSLALPPAEMVSLWTNNTLVAANGNVASGFISVSTLDRLRISRTSAAGAYALEIDWSRDGVAVDITQTIAVNNNSGLEVQVFLPFIRVRVRNTDALAAFTSHRTNVFGR